MDTDTEAQLLHNLDAAVSAIQTHLNLIESLSQYRGRGASLLSSQRKLEQALNACREVRSLEHRFTAFDRQARADGIEGRFNVYNVHQGRNTKFPSVTKPGEAETLARAYAKLGTDAFLRVFEETQTGETFVVAYSVRGGEVTVHRDVTIPRAHWFPIGEPRLPVRPVDCIPDTVTPLDQRRRDRDAGKNWFNSLSPPDKWELGDQFVLGTFDWRDWADMAGWTRKPTAAFLNGVEEARIYWETMQ